MFFDGLDGFLRLMTILLVVFVPLGLWKLVEIIIWMITHINIQVI